MVEAFPKTHFRRCAKADMSSELQPNEARAARLASPRTHDLQLSRLLTGLPKMVSPRLHTPAAGLIEALPPTGQPPRDCWVVLHGLLEVVTTGWRTRTSPQRTGQSEKRPHCFAKLPASLATFLIGLLGFAGASAKVVYEWRLKARSEE